MYRDHHLHRQTDVVCEHECESEGHRTMYHTVVGRPNRWCVLLRSLRLLAEIGWWFNDNEHKSPIASYCHPFCKLSVPRWPHPSRLLIPMMVSSGRRRLWMRRQRRNLRVYRDHHFHPHPLLWFSLRQIVWSPEEGDEWGPIWSRRLLLMFYFWDSLMNVPGVWLFVTVERFLTC